MDLFASATDEVRSTLKDPQKISVHLARAIIGRYTTAVAGHFTSWMGATAVSAKSELGRHAASENLEIEFKENHVALLFDFAGSAQALPNWDDHSHVRPVVMSVYDMVSDMSGLRNLALMATLESTSTVFIPWLEELAHKCNGRDFRYTQMHGVADIAHAEQFVRAVEAERPFYADADKQIKGGVAIAVDFLRLIFKTPR
jgi:hypothetical protein